MTELPGKPEEIQPLSEGRPERNPFILALGEKCVERRLQEVLNLNPKTWNDLKNKGIIPRTGTNGEFLTKVFAHYYGREEVSAARVNAAIEGNRARYQSTDSGLPKIVEAEKLQKIRLDKAREEEVHLKNLQTRSSLLNKQELLALVSPLIGNIANVLRSAADDTPELQPIIDKCFQSLFSTGMALCKQADEDSERYVREMLTRDINLDDLIADADLGLGN